MSKKTSPKSPSDSQDKQEPPILALPQPPKEELEQFDRLRRTLVTVQSALGRAETIHGACELWERVKSHLRIGHAPGKRGGGKVKSDEITCYAFLAKELGCSEKTVRRYDSIGEKLDVDLRRIAYDNPFGLSNEFTLLWRISELTCIDHRRAVVREASEGIAAARKALEQFAADGDAKISRTGAKDTIKVILRMREPLEFDFTQVRSLRVLSADNEQVILSACLKRSEGEPAAELGAGSITLLSPGEHRSSGAANSDGQSSDKTGDRAPALIRELRAETKNVDNPDEGGARIPPKSTPISERELVVGEQQADGIQSANIGIEDPQPEPTSRVIASDDDTDIPAIATWETLMAAEGVPLTAKVAALRKHGDEVECIVRPHGKDLTRAEVFGDLSEFVRLAYGKRLPSLKSKAGKYRLRALRDNATPGATVVQVYGDAAGAASLVGRGTILSDGGVSPLLVFAPKNPDGRDFVIRAPKNSKCLGIPMVTLIREASKVQSAEAAE